MNLEFSGVVHSIGDVLSFGSRGFKKRPVVIEVPGTKYADYIEVEMTGNALDNSSGLQVGDTLSLKCNINGRKWQRDANSDVKYFTSVSCWSFVVTKRADGEGGGYTVPATDKGSEYNQDQYEDIPF